ncbi:MAG: caspase family protein [Thermoanaerobaculia bacterium]
MKTPDTRVLPGIRRIASWLILGTGATLLITGNATANVAKQIGINPDEISQAPPLPPEPHSIFSQNKIVIVDCDLPKNFAPPSLPARPLDETLRVGLVLPVFDPDAERNATWLAGNRFILNFAGSSSAVLPRIIGRLFPRTEILRSNADTSQHDLVLRITLTAGTIANPDDTFHGAFVTGTIVAEANNRTPIVSITASGRAESNKSIYWSQYTMGRAAGVPALQSMLDRLVRNLIEDVTFKAYVREASAQRARPSELETTARFDDSLALFPNGRLDGGENAKILFKVHNRGAGPAFAVHLRVSSPTMEIALPGDTEIGDLPPRGEKEVSVAMGGGLGLETGVLKLPIETIEKRGYGGRQIILEVATEKLMRPNLEIADITLSGPEGRAESGDGRPANGETLEAVVLIRNSGPGDAAGVELTAASAAGGVEILEPRVGVTSIPANGVREARMHVRLPVTFDARDLPLTFRAVEARGAEVAQASKDKTWQVQLRRPAVELTYRMYDGNSAGSHGDRDGVANNDEEVELVLTPANHGALPARDVRISLVSPQAGVTLSQDSFQVGDLPANAEGAEQRVRLQIARTLGRDAAIDKLTLAATITQRDFSARKEPITLPFKARHPELVASVTNSSPLIEGESAILWLEVRNQGLLAAQGVRVDVGSDNQGIDLLDELGAPTPKLRLDIGTVVAQVSTPKIQIKAHIRRGISAAEAVLRVAVSQQDFPSIDQQASLRIQKEEAVIISASPSPLPTRLVTHGAAAPASVFFRDYETGQSVAEETVILRFEVQSQSSLDTVRLEQNHNVLHLAPPKSDPNQATHLWLYEQQVYLTYGANDFEVVMVTAEGIRNSRILSLNRQQPGKLWVAVVGISKYADRGITELRYAREDAVAVLSYYRNRFGLPEEQIFQVLDEKATLGNIKRTLGTELGRKANNPNDTVILYFAGHGQPEQDPGSPDSDGFSKYILPYDTNLADLYGSALNMDELTRILQRLKAERVALIIDSCFSGAAGGRTLFNPNVGVRSTLNDNEFLSRMVSAGKGRVILTASGSTEPAQEWEDKQHGIFTYYLLQGLTGDADYDGDGNIDSDEIYNFVSQMVSKDTHKLQNPVKTNASSQTGKIVLGKTTARIKQ